MCSVFNLLLLTSFQVKIWLPVSEYELFLIFVPFWPFILFFNNIHIHDLLFLYYYGRNDLHSLLVFSLSDSLWLCLRCNGIHGNISNEKQWRQTALIDFPEAFYPKITSYLGPAYHVCVCVPNLDSTTNSPCSGPPQEITSSGHVTVWCLHSPKSTGRPCTTSQRNNHKPSFEKQRGL